MILGDLNYIDPVTNGPCEFGFRYDPRREQVTMCQFRHDGIVESELTEYIGSARKWVLEGMPLLPFTPPEPSEKEEA